MQGSHARYDLTMCETGELIVTDLLTSELIPSQKSKSKTSDKPPTWRIIDHNGKARYFDQKEIDNCYLRKKLKERTQEELNLRNNVEATIFQLGYHYPNKKSRYRGLVKHEIWTFVRCIWINFVRISKYLKSLVPKGRKMETELIKTTIFIFLLIKFVILNVILKNLGKKLKARTQEELNMRNNVEATIFQLGYHYPHKKSRYRGLVKHKIWAFVRCIWINFVRISKYLKSLAPKGGKMVAELIKSTLFLIFFVKFLILNVFFTSLGRKLAVQWK